MKGYFVYNPQPGTRVQCTNCSAPVTVAGRGLHRWVECRECGTRTEWHENEPAPGVNCNCGSGIPTCPAHGKTKKMETAAGIPTETPTPKEK